MLAVDDAVVAGLRAIPDVRGKASVGIAWKHVRERGLPIDGAWDLRMDDGSLVTLPRGSRMAWTVASTGCWDRHVIELVKRHVAQGSLVIDVGASLGLWSLPLGNLAQAQQGSLWAFEPDPQNLVWLRANVERNGLTNVIEVHPYALGSRSGTALLGHREHGGGNAALQPHPDAGTVEVDVVPLDELEISRRVSFIKLDVEGFELEVLRGARNMIERDRPVIFGEFSSYWLRRRGEDLPSYLCSLSSLGYQLFSLDIQRSSAWRARDQATLRRLDPKLASGEEDLLLVGPAQA